MAAPLPAFNSRNLRGYGQNPPNPKWPDNAKLAVSFVVNYEEGGENTPDNGDASTEVFLNETPGGQPRVGGIRDMNMETQYEYGSRCGVWRILRLFEEFRLKFTCFAVGRAVERYAHPIVRMHELGHEVASHNHRWIDYLPLSPAVETQHIKDCIKALKKCHPQNKAPVGWYTGRISPNSRQLVLDVYKEMGEELLYDCDAYNDDLPYWIDVERDGRKVGHLVLSYTLDQNDMKFCVPPGFGSPSAFTEYIINAISFLLGEGRAGQPKFISIGLHCRLVGKPGRAAALKKVLEYLEPFVASGEVWVATREQIARHFKETVPY